MIHCDAYCKYQRGLRRGRAMKCVVATRFGKAEDVLEIAERPRPERGPRQLLLQVFACGLTPGDVRMLSGCVDMFRMPVGGFPYIPALDVCGRVVEADEESNFKCGDVVIATWDNMGIGGMAEYAVVDEGFAALKPDGVNAIEAAAMVNSAVYAMLGVERAKPKRTDRVLVLGGSGGLGTFLVQLLRPCVSYIACTSTDASLMTSLGVDDVCDYRSAKWHEVLEGPFDIVFDCAEGTSAWQHSTIAKTACKQGRWLSYVYNEWHMEIHTTCDMCSLMLPPCWKQCYTSLLCCGCIYPSYTMMLGGMGGQAIARMKETCKERQVKVVLHKQQAFPFTLEGVKAAFTTMERRAGHGNVVVHISDE